MGTEPGMETEARAGGSEAPVQRAGARVWHAEALAQHAEALAGCAERLGRLLSDAALKDLPGEKAALLFSGGVDSALLALLLKRAGADFVCYTTAVDGVAQAKDLEAAQSAAAEIGVGLHAVEVSLDGVECALGEVAQILGQIGAWRGRGEHGALGAGAARAAHGALHVGVGTALYCSLKQAKRDGCMVAYSGLGADELFGGYAEFRERGAGRDACGEFLGRLRVNDLPRDMAIAGGLGIGLRVPYLDDAVVEFALGLGEEFKLGREKEGPVEKGMEGGMNKIVLRAAAEKMGLPAGIAHRAKKAAQYGSGIDKAVEIIAKGKGFKSKGEYIESLVKK